MTSDGKNAINLEIKKNKMRASTASINSIAASEVLYKIETRVLLNLHEKINVSSLLTNSESWNLSRGEREEIDKIEIQSLK